MIMNGEAEANQIPKGARVRTGIAVGVGTEENLENRPRVASDLPLGKEGRNHEGLITAVLLTGHLEPVDPPAVVMFCMGEMEKQSYPNKDPNERTNQEWNLLVHLERASLLSPPTVLMSCTDQMPSSRRNRANEHSNQV